MKTNIHLVNPRNGKERPVAAKRVLNPIGEAHFDGWQNVVTGLGTSADKRNGGSVAWNPYTMEFYEQLYSGDEMASRIVDMIPDDALRKWIKVKGKHKQKPIAKNVLEEVERRLSNLDARGSCERTWKWARAFGGGLQHIVTDCVDPSMPLNPEKERVIALREFSRYDIRIMSTDVETDFGSENYGNPNTYYLSVQMGTNVKLYPIHWTRVIRYDGKMVPRRTYIRNNYWHDSVLQRLFNVIRNYQTSNDSAAAILQDFNVGVFKMKDLASLISAGKESVVKSRIEMVNYCKSTIRAMLLDADSEEYVDMARNVTGLPEMLDHQARRFIAATEIPHTKFMGESPDGSNATGNSTTQLWREHIGAEQNNYLRPRINRLFAALFWDMPDLSYDFVELEVLSKTEKADLYYKHAQADQIYLAEQVLDPSEIAKSRFGGDEYGEEIQLDIEGRRAGHIGVPQEPPQMGEQDEAQPNPDAPPGGRANSKQDGEAGDEEGSEGDEEPLEEEGPEYNPWEEFGEEEEAELPQSLQESPLDPNGLEIPRDTNKSSLRNSETKGGSKKAKPVVSMQESLPMRDPNGGDPRTPPPGRRAPTHTDVEGRYSAAGGSQRIPAASSVKQRGDAGESSLMPRSLDHTKGASHGASVVIQVGSEILMGKRRDTGAWALPGGKIEQGEIPKLAARRELYEETNIRVVGGMLQNMKQHILEDHNVFTYRALFTSKPPVDPSNDPDKEFTELKWVDITNGLPAEIANNLHHVPNLALQDVGLAKSDV